MASFATARAERHETAARSGGLCGARPAGIFESNPGRGKRTDTAEHAAIEGDGRIELTHFYSARWRRKNILERNHEGRIRPPTSCVVVSGSFYVRYARMANGLRKFDWRRRCQ